MISLWMCVETIFRIHVYHSQWQLVLCTKWSDCAYFWSHTELGILGSYFEFWPREKDRKREKEEWYCLFCAAQNYTQIHSACFLVNICCSTEITFVWFWNTSPGSGLLLEILALIQVISRLSVCANFTSTLRLLLAEKNSEKWSVLRAFV